MEKIIIGGRAQEVYETMLKKLTDHQVLVPKFKKVEQDLEIGGWTLKNIRKLSMSQIRAVVNYSPEQLINNKRELLAAREERLRGMRR